jgi:hypothetical protein
MGPAESGPFSHAQAKQNKHSIKRALDWSEIALIDGGYAMESQVSVSLRSKNNPCVSQGNSITVDTRATQSRV